MFLYIEFQRFMRCVFGLMVLFDVLDNACVCCYQVSLSGLSCFWCVTILFVVYSNKLQTVVLLNIDLSVVIVSSMCCGRV